MDLLVPILGSPELEQSSSSIKESNVFLRGKRLSSRRPSSWSLRHIAIQTALLAFTRVVLGGPECWRILNINWISCHFKIINISGFAYFSQLTPSFYVGKVMTTSEFLMNESHKISGLCIIWHLWNLEFEGAFFKNVLQIQNFNYNNFLLIGWMM